MASIRSLGEHTPSALPFLIAEGILPEHANEKLYQWETYHDEDEIGVTEDELLTTEYCVVWSRAGIVRKVYNFEVEKERVVQAVLTSFPSTQAPNLSHSTVEIDNGSPDKHSSPTVDDSSRHSNRQRALVALLKHQAHVFFLSGSSHVVNLPFEVEKAFPAPRGLLLQRKIAILGQIPSTPALPTAPQNSFTSILPSSQASRLSQSWQPTSIALRASGAKAQRSRNANALLLEELLESTKPSTSDTLPRLFSFSDPLAEMGLVVTPRQSTATSSYYGRQDLFESLPKSEQLLYVSPHDEMNAKRNASAVPLLVLLTTNPEKKTYSVWQAFYSRVSSNNSRANARTSVSNGKARRRSSYGPTGTGATTPALRASMRQSEGGAARSKTVPASFSASQGQGQNPTHNQKDTIQKAEDALASQVDPDFNLPSQPTRDPRRVSSLLSRADLSTSFDQSAFQGLATSRASLGVQARRGQSLGGAADRASFGAAAYRRARESTPGSVSRLSLGGLSVDEDVDDIMSNADDDDNDLIDDIFGERETGHGTQELRESLGGLRKEMVLRNIAEIPVTQSQSQEVPKIYVITAPIAGIEPQRQHFLYIVRTSHQSVIEVALTSTPRPLPSYRTPRREQGAPRSVPVLSLAAVKRFDGYVDACKIIDGDMTLLLCLTKGQSRSPTLSLHRGWTTQPDIEVTLPSLRLFNPYSMDQQLSPSRREAGLKRTLGLPKALRSLDHAGPDGIVTLTDGNPQSHKLQLHFRPRNKLVGTVLYLIRTLMDGESAELLLSTWWSILSTITSSDGLENEWLAMVATLFSMAVPSLDEPGQFTNAVASPGARHSRRSSAKHAATETAQQQMWSRETTTGCSFGWSGPCWGWTTRHDEEGVSSRRSTGSTKPNSSMTKTDQLVVKAVHAAKTHVQAYPNRVITATGTSKGHGATSHPRHSHLQRLTVALHLLHEELKLNALPHQPFGCAESDLVPVVAQLGHWLGWTGWDWRPDGYYGLQGANTSKMIFEQSLMQTDAGSSPPWETPPSIFEWIERVGRCQAAAPFPSLAMLLSDQALQADPTSKYRTICDSVTPRTVAIVAFFNTGVSTKSSFQRIELMKECGIHAAMLETLPEGVLAPFRQLIADCQGDTPATWNSQLLQLVEREDLDIQSAADREAKRDTQHIASTSHASTADVHTICQLAETSQIPHGYLQSSAEADRYAITRLLFVEDRRFWEAARLISPLRPAVAECTPDPSWSEAEQLEAQKDVMQWVMIRTFALPAGQAMINLNSRRPLITERYPLHGFATVCYMKPMNITVSADRSVFTEEKHSWAWFHAGVSAGLGISPQAEGIDTSWIAFNKPNELGNKHAGLLLGLGLNGHLRSLAKWLSFKYLTPKHTMTSIGLLLGLSASYLGTMDMLVTRLLSVHVTRMLPPGAAELNLPPLVQTAGLLGIGLLYYNTQHRRMSEVMLSEIEHVEVEDPSGTPDIIRDEGYRLAAGFALGFINLGKGKDLQGLHDMRLIERLLAVAIGPKQVDVVHILDQATAGAVIAITLIYMKSGNQSVARKVDIPDTVPQFDYVRPDVFLLRTLAKHLILWNDIKADQAWLVANLPTEHRISASLKTIKALRSEQMPFFNIIAGLLWAIGLRHAGSGNTAVRDFLVQYLDQFLRLSQLPAHRYDGKLTRNTVRHCQDIVALSSATVMAGTGDLVVFRRLRALHGRLNADMPYGSHMAAHLAMGTLFLAGGTYTFSTSNLSLASLICAFYPLFPSDVLDNRAHLQAFRHLWILAAEPRCIVIRDVDTHRAISLPIEVTFKDNSIAVMKAPCLLPELDTISRLRTHSPEHWTIALDFIANASHLASFRATQTLYVRRLPPSDAHSSAFAATLMAFNDAASQRSARLMWDWVFTLPSFAEFSTSDRRLVIPSDPHSGVGLDARGSVVDSRLALAQVARKGEREWELWQLRVLFGWAEKVQAEGKVKWLGTEMVERLKRIVSERMESVEGGR